MAVTHGEKAEVHAASDRGYTAHHSLLCIWQSKGPILYYSRQVQSSCLISELQHTREKDMNINALAMVSDC